MNNEQQCSTGPTALFTDVEQCPNTPSKWLFGELYCDECYNVMVKLHAKLNHGNN